MEKLYPRRRHVRQFLDELSDAIANNLDDEGEYEKDFLNTVRDLMRDGLTFGDALVIAASPEFTAEVDGVEIGYEYAGEDEDGYGYAEEDPDDVYGYVDDVADAELEVEFTPEDDDDVACPVCGQTDCPIKGPFLTTRN